MPPDAIAGIISGAGFLFSVIGSAFIAGYRWGSVKTRLEIIEKSQATMATKEQLAGVKEDVAEIKGMFRMTLRDGSLCLSR
ncbi:MAG TPA: hypothetical protein VGR89_10665 [Puia sp.]|nr:hypothetical protein [Puia sp.]